MIKFCYSHCKIGMVQVHYTNGCREVMTQAEFAVAFADYDISGEM